MCASLRAFESSQTVGASETTKGSTLPFPAGVHWCTTTKVFLSFPCPRSRFIVAPHGRTRSSSQTERRGALGNCPKGRRGHSWKTAQEGCHTLPDTNNGYQIRIYVPSLSLRLAQPGRPSTPIPSKSPSSPGIRDGRRRRWRNLCLDASLPKHLAIANRPIASTETPDPRDVERKYLAFGVCERYRTAAEIARNGAVSVSQGTSKEKDPPSAFNFYCERVC
jgi:hypothetical protein